jgi:hypothetical protein
MSSRSITWGCEYLHRFFWGTPSHASNHQENSQVQEVSLAKDLDLHSFGEDLSTSMSLWVLFREYPLKAWVWTPKFFSRTPCTHGFWREDHSRVWVQLRCFEVHPHAFLNLKRTHDFGNLHVLVGSPDGESLVIMSMTKFSWSTSHVLKPLENPQVWEAPCNTINFSFPFLYGNMGTYIE